MFSWLAYESFVSLELAIARVLVCSAFLPAACVRRLGRLFGRLIDRSSCGGWTGVGRAIRVTRSTRIGVHRSPCPAIWGGP